MQSKHPHTIGSNRQHHSHDQPDKTTRDSPLGGASFPQHRHEQHREVGRGGNHKSQHHHESDVFFLESNTKGHGDDAQDHRGDLGNAQLISLVNPAFSPH